MSFDVRIEPTAGFDTIDDDSRLMRLYRPFHASVNGLPVTVPTGFLTDLASIPRLARWFMDGAHPHILRAAILHDYLYQTQARFDRRQADQILSQAMRCCRATWTERAVVYLAVRAGGWLAWNNHSKRKFDLQVAARFATDARTNNIA